MTLTKREKWMLHKLEFQRMLQAYAASGKEPIRHLLPGGDKIQEKKEED